MGSALEFKQIVEWLLANQYLLLVNNRPVLTAKFEKEVGYNNTNITYINVGNNPPNPQILEVQTTSGESMKKITDLKLMWNAFISDCELPHRVKTTDGSTFTIRQYSQAIARKLQKIIQDPKIDYWRLVESTKNYYKTVTYKQLLSNYISKDIWLHEYNEWDKATKQTHISDGSNRWESE